ncbi:ankyrin repeat domain-containing protein [Actibacterium pelagium]|uniref:Ankyrin repeats (3 copies) n=1 Tax=Actibacterium pelagium TaxID=2029103 RepID=A0A917EHT4_9RHOB|nr:ankyrin repeat domain-containing protein [Actibacterium pelagium]GGE36766.1 hypothetical protein GCM10011517_00600 [Actibacterium pelagium]
MKQKPYWITLPKRIAAFSLAMLLSACIYSVDPVLDETNSTAGKDSAEYKAFLDAWYLVYSEADGTLSSEGTFFVDDDGTFVDFKYIRVTALGENNLLVQQREQRQSDCVEDHCFLYYSVQLPEPWWPSYCLAKHDEEFQEAMISFASSHGVTLVVLEGGNLYGISGPKENFLPYLKAQFSRGPMFCNNEQGRTPLHEAEIFEDVPGRITKLVEMGADPNARMVYEGCEGVTPLHVLASSSLDSETIEELVSTGADVNATMCDGWTPLHLAASSPDPQIIETFLDLGADGSLRTKDGKTPFELMPPPSADDPFPNSPEYEKAYTKAYKRLEQAQKK